jgi:hypothetical protein
MRRCVRFALDETGWKKVNDGKMESASLIYSLVRTGELLGDSSLIELARDAANLVTTDLLERTKYPGLPDGTIAILFGLLALNKYTNDDSILERAALCGDHLLQQIEQPAAGRDHALNRLYDITNLPRFKRAVGLPRPATSSPGLLDFGLALLSSEESGDFACEWLKTSLSQLCESELMPHDSVAEGNFGFLELAVEAGSRFSRPDLLDAGICLAGQAVARAKNIGGYQICGGIPVSAPCFGYLHGMAGIGYTLLRFAMELSFGPSSSIRDYMRAAVLPYVSRCLISDESLSEMVETAACLPGGLTNFFGFECPLGRREGQADLLVCAAAAEGGRAVLAGEGAAHLPNVFENHPTWRKAFTFAKCWNDPLSPLFENVHNLWLEFDTTGQPASIPSPSIFFGAHSLERLLETECAEALSTRCAWLTQVALPVLRDQALPVIEQAQITRCIEALPFGARVFQVGLMLSRPSQSTRICVRGIPADQIIDYLQHVGWGGSPIDLGVVIDTLSDYVDSFSVDIDVSDRVLPKIGLECYCGVTVEKISSFLEYLVSAGFARPEKAEAVAAWRGMVHERLSADAWPSDLLAASAFMSGRLHSMFHRRLHHIKVVYEPGQALHAKAYLAVQHVWVEPQLLRQALENMNSRPPDGIVFQGVATPKGEPCAPVC